MFGCLQIISQLGSVSSMIGPIPAFVGLSQTFAGRNGTATVPNSKVSLQFLILRRRVTLARNFSVKLFRQRQNTTSPPASLRTTFLASPGRSRGWKTNTTISGIATLMPLAWRISLKRSRRLEIKPQGINGESLLSPST